MQSNIRELIEIANIKLGLPEYVIEKDFYVTKAIHALADIESNYFQLVFQGGTCLAKAHRIVQRMSEDADFRMEAKPETFNLGKDAYRKHLRAFRHLIIETLKQAGFNLSEKDLQVGNLGQFMQVQLKYDPIFPIEATLRPHIQLEFTAIGTKTPVQKLPINSLLYEAIGEDVQETTKEIHCVSVLETAAEKWVALTRRVATIDRGYQEQDPTLIRHLYDLYMISQMQSLGESFYKLAAQIISEDIRQYKNHNPEYAMNPVQEIQRALNALTTDLRWHDYWQSFILVMVFKPDVVNYEQASNWLLTLSKTILSNLN